MLNSSFNTLSPNLNSYKIISAKQTTTCNAKKLMLSAIYSSSAHRGEIFISQDCVLGV